MEAYEQLERNLEAEAWCGGGYRHVVVCSSGTAALHLALETLRLPLGSRVIVPEFTMISCARAVTLAGLQPVFVDCNGADLCIDTVALASLPVCRSNVTAIMPVHVYGRSCNMEWITRWAADRDIAVVEDLAEAHGIPPHRDTVAACWSFYRNKIVAGEEGGAVAFLRREHADYARQLRSVGFTPEHNFIHVPRGHNYRLSNIHAHLIQDSLDHMEANWVKRRALEREYEAALAPLDLPAVPPRVAPWVYDIALPHDRRPAVELGGVVDALCRAGVPARAGFRPMSEQPEYLGGTPPPTATARSRDTLYLPLTPGAGDEWPRRAATALGLVLGGGWSI